MRLVKQMNNYISISYKDRSLLQVFQKITDCCKRNDINDKIINESHGIYKHISSKKISRGKNRLGIIAACVFMAAKNTGHARSSKEISKIFECDAKVITKGIKSVNDILRIHKIGNRINKERVEYSDLISRFCNNLPLNHIQIEGIHDLSKNCLALNQAVTVFASRISSPLEIRLSSSSGSKVNTSISSSKSPLTSELSLFKSRAKNK